MPTSDGDLEERRWQLLRWARRHDSGVLYAAPDVTEVRVDTLLEAIPLLVSTKDFAPADMQYRMHREHLWDPATGLYGEAYDVDKATWVAKVPTASGNGKAALALATALRQGGEGVPSEMRGRWRRNTRDLLAACESAGLVDPALAEATRIAAEDGWLEAE